MARRAAAKGTRRPRKPSPPSSAAGGEDGAAEGAHPKAAARGSGGGFFCCYLLRSLCPRLKGRTYIGFTVNPRRRIRQHNGEISSGAWRTRRGRPWEMVLCIHGFPTNVAALQFEWAWQHPKESLAVRKAASSFKSLSGAGNKVKLAYAMLNLPSWENLNLTVNFFSSTSAKFATGCPPLPSQMKTVVCPMEDLQCHAEAISGDLCDSSQGHQGPESLHEDEHSWKQPSFDQEQPMDAQTRTAICYVEEDNYSSDDFASMEWDGILDLTEQDESRTLPQCHQGPDLLRSDEQSEHSWKQSSSDQVQPIDAQSRTAVYDVEEDNYSGDDFAPAEWDEILDLTEPNRSRTSPQCSLSSNSDDGSVVEGELGQTSPQTSPMWKVVCAGSDGGVLEDELGQAVSPAWKACSGSDAVNDELVQASPVLKAGADSDCHDRGVTNDELGQASPMLMIDAGSDEGKRDMVVDLVTPTPVGRLRRRAGAGSICHMIIDLTASPAVIEL